ncbi:cadherin-like beta sandwich domain-containing protein [uncultured Clostridium sp.]|uniref:cadherin-like beta sandwich domain-containing protein n=1 Tax=uncultured Clostridium sp. TaxID=59620 RepID=UPI0028EA231A|nr:cadherin-like beta sandwich domain-containing protein [uncultured Clostridium sp.]
MNKNLKKIIAIGLMFETISTIGAATPISLLTKTVYASSDSNDEDELNSLKVETSNGSGIKLYYDDSYENYNKVDYDDVESDHTYYARTSVSSIKLEQSGPDSKYVRVFNGTSDSTKGEDINSNISLSPGINVITVRVYKEEPDKYLEYEDKSEVQNSYIINIEYNPDEKGDDDNDIYLKSLTIDDNDIKLTESKTSYNYSVGNNVDEVSIKAKPEDNDYSVTIDGDDVDESDRFEKDVILDNGENDIKIEIEDNDNDYKEYTLKINKGNSSAATSNNMTASNAQANNTANGTTVTSKTGAAANETISAVKASQWVQVNGKWQYNNSAGNPIKNQWFFDKSYGKWYYLGTDGFMEENCWVLSGSKYYYLNADGSMAVNTIVNGYKVGTDGAWIS